MALIMGSTVHPHVSWQQYGAGAAGSDFGCDIGGVPSQEQKTGGSKLIERKHFAMSCLAAVVFGALVGVSCFFVLETLLAKCAIRDRGSAVAKTFFDMRLVPSQSRPNQGNRAGFLRAAISMSSEDAGKSTAAKSGEVVRKVSVFGARLDADVVELSSTKVQEEWGVLFIKGNEFMLRGDYNNAVTAFTQAIAAVPGGIEGRKGGQYAVILAQALHAAGREKESVDLLRKCTAHDDKDVRKVADEVQYIMNAKGLELNENDRVQWKLLDHQDDSWTRKKREWGRKWATYRAPPTTTPLPRKYSPEWYKREIDRFM